MKDFSFFEQVWEIVKLIPCGRVTSYGAIARALGSADFEKLFWNPIEELEKLILPTGITSLKI